MRFFDANGQRTDYLVGKFSQVVLMLEDHDYEHSVRWTACDACGDNLDQGESPNPRIRVKLESGLAWHDDCHQRYVRGGFPAQPSKDDAEAAAELIAEHRIKILERMGRAA